MCILRHGVCAELRYAAILLRGVCGEGEATAEGAPARLSEGCHAADGYLECGVSVVLEGGFVDGLFAPICV